LAFLRAASAARWSSLFCEETFKKQTVLCKIIQKYIKQTWEHKTQTFIHSCKLYKCGQSITSYLYISWHTHLHTSMLKKTLSLVCNEYSTTNRALPPPSYKNIQIEVSHILHLLKHSECFWIWNNFQ
jgi:hypothetical protein